MAVRLGKRKKVVMIGGECRLTSEIAKLSVNLHPAIQVLTGIDLTKVILHDVICTCTPGYALIEP